jgi:hypothetical protein
MGRRITQERDDRGLTALSVRHFHHGRTISLPRPSRTAARG